MIKLFIFVLVQSCLLLGQSQAAADNEFCDALTDETPYVIWSYAELKEEFQAVEKYLVEHVPTDDKVANVEKAGQYLKEVGRTAKHKSFGDKLVKALIAFHNLPQAIDKRACEHSIYRGLLKVILPTQCQSHTKKPSERSRIEKILYEYASEHAEMCKDKYLERFEKDYATIDAETKRIVSELFSPEIEQKILANLNETSEHASIINIGMDKFSIDAVPFKDILMRVESFATLPEKEMYSKDTNGFVQVKFLPLPDKFGPDLIEKYVIKPCRKIKGSMALVFQPARLDAFLHADQWMQKAPEDSITTSEEFVKVWHNFRLCELILSNEDDELVEMFKEIAYPEVAAT